MVHSGRLAAGLQGLLTEGSFVDVRICCSDHSMSDGLGAHRAVLAAASPQLLGPSMAQEGEPEDMVCLHLPDYPSQTVASVLSILYYGETWLQAADWRALSDSINSLLASLGIGLEVWPGPSGPCLRPAPPRPPPAEPHHPQHPPAPPLHPKRPIKTEPPCEPTVPLLYSPPGQDTLSPASIKRERMEPGRMTVLPQAMVLPQAASFALVHPPPPSSHSSHSSSSSFPLIQTTSLLKCPAPHCGYCSLSIPEIQAHIARCRPPSLAPPATHKSDLWSSKSDLLAQNTAPVLHVDVKPPAGLKREVGPGIKQEVEDPLAKRELEEAEEEEEEEEESDDIESISSCSSSAPACCPEPDCSYTTSSLSSLQAHAAMHRRKAVLRANGEVGPVGRHKLQCDQCDYSATTTTHLKNHLMQHLDERPHQCSVCSKAFRTRPQAAEHEMAVHGAAEEVECDQCDKRFASRGGLARHRQAHHSGRSHACADCDKTFASRASLRSHERRAHRAEVAVQEEELCPSCGLAGSSCGCGVVPGPGPAPASVPCPVCGKQVVRRNLASHLHYHRQSALRPYICQQCSATFTHASSLKRHALLHGGVRPFSCTACNKGFYQRVAWLTHLKSHTSERLPCPACAKPFLTKYLLNQHLKARKTCRESSGP